jgi:hypothetical protein
MALTDGQLGRLTEDGYLHVPGVVPDAVLLAVEWEYDKILSDLIDRLVTSEEAGDIRSAGSFGKRLVALASRADVPLIPNFEISYPFTGIDASTPISLGDAVFRLITCAEILDVVESILGAEISSNPVQHARIKLPAAQSAAIARNGALAAKTGWHQDLAAVLPEADLTDEVTVWVAMTDATEENGCLVYLPGSHRTGLAFHCKPTNMGGRGGSNIPTEYIYEPGAVAVPVSRGDILIHTMLTKHSSLDNTSSETRWSFDLRYHRTGQPTGRPVFPSVVVRSRADPSAAIRDPQVWRDRWFAARDNIAANASPPVFNRWNVDSPFC